MGGRKTNFFKVLLFLLLLLRNFRASKNGAGRGKGGRRRRRRVRMLNLNMLILWEGGERERQLGGLAWVLGSEARRPLLPLPLPPPPEVKLQGEGEEKFSLGLRGAPPLTPTTQLSAHNFPMEMCLPRPLFTFRIVVVKVLANWAIFSSVYIREESPYREQRREERERERERERQLRLFAAARISYFRSPSSSSFSTFLSPSSPPFGRRRRRKRETPRNAYRGPTQKSELERERADSVSDSVSRRQRLLATASFLGREKQVSPKKLLAYVGIGRGPLFRILSALPFFFWRHVTAATRRRGTVKVRRREGEGDSSLGPPTSRRHVVPGFRPILAARKEEEDIMQEEAPWEEKEREGFTNT